MEDSDKKRETGFPKLFTLISVVAILCLGVLDHAILPEISFSVFYVAPIALATWYGGKRVGIVLSVVAAVTWMSSDLLSGHQYSHTAIPAWNALVRFTFFLIATFLLSQIRVNLEMEKRLAATDTLTGLANPRSFYDRLRTEIIRSRRYERPITLAYLDLDNFKTVNDTHGHDVGDKVLQTAAQALRGKVREVDVIARLGGDEFIAMFPETGSEAARAVARNLLSTVGQAMREQGWPVGVSIGAVTFDRPMDTAQEMIKAADDLMYTVKKQGKNSALCTRWPEEMNGRPLPASARTSSSNPSIRKGEPT